MDKIKPDLEMVIEYQNNAEFRDYVNKAAQSYDRTDSVEYVLASALTRVQMEYYRKEVCDR